MVVVGRVLGNRERSDTLVSERSVRYSHLVLHVDDVLRRILGSIGQMLGAIANGSELRDSATRCSADRRGRGQHLSAGQGSREHVDYDVLLDVARRISVAVPLLIEAKLLVRGDGVQDLYGAVLVVWKW